MMRKDKRPLQPGDRIRAYYCLGGKPKGTVLSVSGDLLSFKADEDGTTRQAHIKAVRRLVPKAKPEPNGERSRLQRWHYCDTNGVEKYFYTRGQCESLGKRTDADVAYTRLVELREGERILSKEDIARAWDEIRKDPNKRPFFGTAHCAAVSFDFKELALAIGLGGGE